MVSFFVLYIVLFLHQTTTNLRSTITNHLLYIVLFLHQTTTNATLDNYIVGCISYYSYIKPQRARVRNISMSVVYRTIPTSNHNSRNCWQSLRRVVYRTIPTSNHNGSEAYLKSVSVVYRTIPTSNHN